MLKEALKELIETENACYEYLEIKIRNQNQCQIAINYC